MVWLKNSVPTKVLGHDTPYQHLYGHALNFANLPQWGQVVWVHNPDNSKHDACGTPEHWVGYDTDSPHAYRIYWLCANKVSVKCNMKIIEVFADDEATSKMYVPKSTMFKQSLFCIHLNHQCKKSQKNCNAPVDNRNHWSWFSNLLQVSIQQAAMMKKCSQQITLQLLWILKRISF